MIYRMAFFKGKMSSKVVLESEFSLANGYHTRFDPVAISDIHQPKIRRGMVFSSPRIRLSMSFSDVLAM